MRDRDAGENSPPRRQAYNYTIGSRQDVARSRPVSLGKYIFRSVLPVTRAVGAIGAETSVFPNEREARVCILRTNSSLLGDLV